MPIAQRAARRGGGPAGEVRKINLGIELFPIHLKYRGRERMVAAGVMLRPWDAYDTQAL